MKKSTLPIFIIFLFILNSCKKEVVPGVGYAPAPIPGIAEVNNFPLNGGNIVGRWSIYFIQTIDLRNDTLVSLDTTTYPLGGGLITFTNNNIYTIYYQAALIDSGSYSVSGNNLILDDGSGLVNMRYGILSDRSKMRLSFFEQYNSNNNVMKHTEDDMCVPY